LRELVVRLAVPRSLERMVATTCCLRIQMAIGSLFMKEWKIGWLTKGYEVNGVWREVVQEPVAKMRFLFRQLNDLSNEVLDCLSTIPSN
jgi:hypothetical protein